MDARQFINIRGKQYKIEQASKIYFRGLTECLRDLGDVDLLSKSAKTIKKVLIPTISDEIIIKSEDDEEFYLWHPSVEPEEINEIVLSCARCYRLRKLEEAKTKGDENAIKEQEEGLKLIDKYLKPSKVIDLNPDEVVDVKPTQVVVLAPKSNTQIAREKFDEIEAKVLEREAMAQARAIKDKEELAKQMAWVSRPYEERSEAERQEIDERVDEELEALKAEIIAKQKEPNKQASEELEALRAEVARLKQQNGSST